MANKLKVAEKFSAIKTMLNGEKVENFSIEQAVEFINERIAMVEKKSAQGGERKPTKTQLENEVVKERILTALATAGEPTTVGGLQKVSAEMAEFSNQKISALLTQLVTAKLVVRTEVKGRAYFALAEKE